eukprot:828060-Rhodomonas_salina.2
MQCHAHTTQTHTAPRAQTTPNPPTRHGHRRKQTSVASNARETRDMCANLTYVTHVKWTRSACWKTLPRMRATRREQRPPTRRSTVDHALPRAAQVITVPRTVTLATPQHRNPAALTASAPLRRDGGPELANGRMRGRLY